MTPEVQKYYETYFSLFVTDGWKQFLQDVNQNIDNFQILNIKDEANLRFIQGQLDLLYRLQNWENTIKSSYDSVQEQDVYDASETV
jgi:hypothetical protein